MTPIDPIEEAIFLAASALPDPASRAVFLDRACGGDTTLRDRITRLLKAEEQASQFFATDPLDPTHPHSPAAVIPDPPAVDPPGTMIGRYKLLQKIGEGGMGIVYMAEQREPVSRRVALKIIKLGLDTRQVVARFEAERQALALMDHPHIAKVLDGGVTEEKPGVTSQQSGSDAASTPSTSALLTPDSRPLTPSSGRPFFVMELVQGVPITEFCEKNHLSALERLQLFIPVCQAIQHAHHKGVIHRDLKPSNVLVTLSDGVPHPMVIDFGVAKALNQRLTEKTLFTQFATMIGTPAYMSPEQAEMSKLDVDTRSDIYSLGALLYELLTGSTPFPETRLRSVGFGEMQRIIAQEEPERPSTRLTKERLAKPVEGTASNPGSRNPNSSIDPDLDWIVLKCLEKDRSRRYETATGLAADIQRFLRGEPIEARPPSTAYRLQKAIRRNKLAFAAGTAVAAALVAGVSLATFSFFRERAARSEADAGRAEAEKARQDEAIQRQRAEAEFVRARRNLYAADVTLAFQALDAGNLGRARELAEKYQFLTTPRATTPTTTSSTSRFPASLGGAKAMPDTASDLRGWEWRYLWAQTRGEELATLIDHNTEGIRCLDLSVDGRYLVADENAPTLHVRDWTTNPTRVAASIPFSRHLTAVHFTPDGRLLVAADAEPRVHVYETSSWRESFSFTLPSRALALSSAPRSGRLAILCSNGTVLLWSLSEKREVDRLTAAASAFAVSCMAFSSDGSQLAYTQYGTEEDECQVIIWNTATRTSEKFVGHEAGHLGVLSVAFSPDGRLLASAGGDRTVRIWNLPEHRLQKTLKAHVATVFNVAFSPDGTRLASVGADQKVMLWDTVTWQQIASLKGHTDEIWRVRFAPDGTRLVTASKDGTVKVWSTLPPSGSPTFVPNTTTNWWWPFNGDQLQGLHGVQGEHPHMDAMEIWGYEPWGRRLAFTNPIPGTGQILQLSDDEKLVVTASTNKVAIWEANSGRQLVTWAREPRPLRYVHRFRPDLFLMLGRYDNPDSEGADVELWDWKSATMINLPDLKTNGLMTWTSSKDDRWVVFGYCCEERWVDLWDWPARRKVARLPAGATGIALSRDGRTIYTCGYDAKIRVWDVAKPDRPRHVLGGELAAYFSLALSPDETRLVTGGALGQMKVWDLSYDPPQELATINAHPWGHNIHRLNFLPDGNTIVSRGADGMRFWRATAPDKVDLPVEPANPK